MKCFEFLVKNKEGLHARPAGELARLVESFKSEVTLEKANCASEDNLKDGVSKSAARVKADNVIKIMQLGLKKDDRVYVTIRGEDENTLYKSLRVYFEENL